MRDVPKPLVIAFVLWAVIDSTFVTVGLLAIGLACVVTGDTLGRLVGFVLVAVWLILKRDSIRAVRQRYRKMHSR